MESRELDTGRESGAGPDLNTGIESLMKALAERQEAMLRELSELAVAVKRLEGKVDARPDAQPNPQIAERPSEHSTLEDFGAHDVTVEVLDAGATGAAPARKHGVKVEVKAVIAAAVAVAGEMAKARKTPALSGAQDSASAWSQQGRVGVVSSHNLR
ncbi:MAG TPA: hypothetical protein VL986_02575 [Terracidiphilus sp.]|nr:hypothetical protein [Terracidiphilus sp.]